MQDSDLSISLIVIKTGGHVTCHAGYVEHVWFVCQGAHFDTACP